MCISKTIICSSSGLILLFALLSPSFAQTVPVIGTNSLTTQSANSTKTNQLTQATPPKPSTKKQPSSSPQSQPPKLIEGPLQLCHKAFHSEGKHALHIGDYMQKCMREKSPHYAAPSQPKVDTAKSEKLSDKLKRFFSGNSNK